MGLDKQEVILDELLVQQEPMLCLRPVHELTWAGLRATGQFSDLTVYVDNKEFRLHKFPLFAQSNYFQLNAAQTNTLELVDVPGGAYAFSLIADYCYGLPITLTPANIAPIRCAAEYFGMTPERVGSSSGTYLPDIVDSFLEEKLFTNFHASLKLLTSLDDQPHLQDVAAKLNIVKRCCTTLTDYAATIESQPDHNAVWSLIWNLTTLPKPLLMEALTAFKKRGLCFVKTGNRLAETAPGHLWLLSNLDDTKSFWLTLAAVKHEEETEVCISSSLIVAALAAGRRTLLEQCREFFPLTLIEVCSLTGRVAEMEARASERHPFQPVPARCPIPTVSKCSQAWQDKEAAAAICSFLAEMALQTSLQPSPKYMVTLLNKCWDLIPESSFLELIEKKVKANLHELQVEDLQILHLITVCNLFAEPYVIATSNDPVSDNHLAKVAELVDAYLSWAVSSSRWSSLITLDDILLLARAVPGVKRQSYDDLFNAIDTFLKRHTDLTLDSHLALSDLLEEAQLSEQMAWRAVSSSGLPRQSKFMAVQLSALQSAMTAQKQVIEALQQENAKLQHMNRFAHTLSNVRRWPQNVYRHVVLLKENRQVLASTRMLAATCGGLWSRAKNSSRHLLTLYEISQGNDCMVIVVVYVIFVGLFTYVCFT